MHAATAALLAQSSFTTKLKAGGFYSPVNCTVRDGRIILDFGFNRDLLNEVKTCFEGREWLGPPKYPNGIKAWAIPITPRNIFQFEALQGKYCPVSPYAQWDKPFDDLIPQVREYMLSRGIKHPYGHQLDMIAHGLTVRQFIWAAGMGVGKTLAAMMVMELSGITDWMWTGPRSALVSVELEFEKWKSPLRPRFLTYEGVIPLIESWNGKAPQGLIGDEISKIKTPTAKRSVAFKHVADSMRIDWGDNFILGELSGTPAPKSPADWHHICECARPGFLREANIFLFRERLGVFVEKETIPGAGKYKQLVRWKDGSSVCQDCGKEREHINHEGGAVGKATHTIHKYKESENEVANLAKRMKGLVLVKLKDQCLDLPAKRYKIIKCKPMRSVLNAAKLILETTTRAVDAMIRLRALSDGFQYQQKEIGKETCPTCKGKGTYFEWFSKGSHAILTEEEVKNKKRLIYNPESETQTQWDIERVETLEPEQREITCENCKGEKEINVYERIVAEVECPKDQVLRDLLEEHEDVGRLNMYAGFQGSVDRVKNISLKTNWGVIRADGRGWEGWTDKGVSMGCDPKTLMQIYTDVNRVDFPMLFIGQPGAAGMGLTLTVSPTTGFFSNDFNAESRLQAEDRGHRLGMDIERGGLIVDICNLPSDYKILENLKLKKDLQRMSMLGLREAFEDNTTEVIR